MLVESRNKVKGAYSVHLLVDQDDDNFENIVEGTILKWTANGVVKASTGDSLVLTIAGKAKSIGMFYIAMGSYLTAKDHGYIAATPVGADWEGELYNNHAAQAVALGDYLTITNGVFTKCTSDGEVAVAQVMEAQAGVVATDIWKVKSFGFPQVTQA